MKRLTTRQVALLKSIDGGADVFDHGAAIDLRELARTHPDLLRIVDAQGSYGPRDRHPCFGALLTSAGRQAVGCAPRRRMITTKKKRQPPAKRSRGAKKKPRTQMKKKTGSGARKKTGRSGGRKAVPV